MSENPPPQATGDLRVASDETSIYEEGKLISLSIPDLLHNEVALRQLVNSLNIAHRQVDALRNEVHKLQIERASAMLQPAVAVFLAVVNIAGAALIGVGTNLLTDANPISAAKWIFGIGLLLAVVTAVAPIFLPRIISYFRGDK